MKSAPQQNKINWFIGVAILFPLFFQLNGSIFNSKVPLFDSGGVLSQLPLPISLLACLLGGLYLIRNFNSAYLAIGFFMAMLLVMLVSLLFASPSFSIEQKKIIMMGQVLLPTMAMVLGQLVNNQNKVISKSFLAVLIIIAPSQILASILQGSFALTHNLYLFSIYQHFQFVPLIFVCAYAYVMVNLWDSHKTVLYILSLVMLIYVLFSISFLTIFAFLVFVVFFSYTKMADGSKTKFLKILLLIVSLIGFSGLLIYFGHQNSHHVKTGYDGLYIGKIETLSQGKTPTNLQERLADWRLFGNGVLESTQSVMFGHTLPMAREVRSSAHNWYLDTAYTFGMITLLPVIVLCGYTVFRLWQLRRVIPSNIFWLGAIVIYLVVIDSNFKVTLRQPYPGVFAFFMWGMLLKNLQEFNSNWRH